MSSLRARLLAGLLAGVTIFLAANGCAIYWIVRARSIAEIDRSLVELLQSTLPPLVRELGFRGPFEAGRPPRPDRRAIADEERPPRGPGARPDNAMPGLPEREDFLFQAWREDGAPGPHSARLEERALPRLGADATPLAFDELERSKLGFASFELDPPLEGEGRSWRAVGGLFQPPGPPADATPPRGNRVPPPIEVVLAKDVSALDATLASLRWLLFLAWASASLGCAGILSFVVHRGLRPLRRLDRQLAELDAAKLDQRIDAGDLPDELVPVVEQLDAMLARLREAFEREQAFSAYAAHELRTPLAGLRSTLEVSLARPRSVDEHREAEAECLGITKDLEHLVERLLELARASAVVPRLDAEPQRIAPLVDAALARHAAAAGARGLSLVARVPADFAVATDEALLARVLENLLENAVTYADAGGEVQVEVVGEGSAWSLAVSNPASSAPPEIATRAFDAFWRADAARSSVGKHAGLGLALCRRIVERSGGRIAAEFEGGRFAVVARFEPEER